MIVATVWHGRDAYDHTISPMLYQTFKNLSDEHLKDMITQHDKHVKSGILPWYLITVTRFDVGGEAVSETFHRANPVKTKIVLNARAKVEPKQKKQAGAAGLWAQINAAEGYQPAFANGAGVAVNLNDVWINP